MPPIKNKTFKISMSRAPIENDTLVMFARNANYGYKIYTFSYTTDGWYPTSTDGMSLDSTPYNEGVLTVVITVMGTITPLYMAFLPSPI